MNSLILAGISGILFLSGYHIYAKKLEHIWKIDPKRKTPALKKPDGVDYIPVKHWSILFGHHFASIAGAAPIIGPVVAALLWGWLPAALWILFGSIFLGGMHDFSALVLSLRYDGRSVGEISKSVLNKKSKIICSWNISIYVCNNNCCSYISGEEFLSA